jgi:hypothetical protein
VLLGIGSATVAGRFQVFLAQVGLGVGLFPVHQLWRLFLVFIQGRCADSGRAFDFLHWLAGHRVGLGRYLLQVR